MAVTRNVVVMIDLNWPLAHHMHVFAGIDRYAREHGNWEYSVNPHADQLLTGRRGRRPDGIIARATLGLAKRACAARVPVVNVWLNSPAHGLPAVFHDAQESGRMAARHLMTHGFRRFAYLGFARDRCAMLQLAGYRETLHEAGYDCSSCWTTHNCSQSGANWQQFQARLREWIKGWTPPVAVFSTNDLLNRYLVDACHNHGLEVPGDVALLGSFNEPMICSRPEPALSSIDFGFENVGFRAAELLDKIMNGTPAPTAPIWVPPADLVIRRSSNVFAADDPVVSGALRYISDHVCKSITVDEVADHVAVTRRTLARIFQKLLGKSIHETITQMRLERVKRELMETSNPLKSIAGRCGFRDAIHLCKVFQRQEKITPGRYRAQRATLARAGSNDSDG